MLLRKSSLLPKYKLSTLVKNQFSDFKNSDAINKMLKDIKAVNDEQFKLIQNTIKDTPKVHLFRVNLFTKLCFILSRYQVFGYCFASAGYTFYTIYTKWNEITASEKEKLTKKQKKEIEKKKKKLWLGTIVLFLSSSLAFYITWYMGKRIVKSIYYLPQKNLFQINYFSWLCLDKPVYVDPAYITRLQKPRRFDSTILYEIVDKNINYKLISAKGTGVFLNKSLFDYIIDNPNNQIQN